LGIGYHFVIGNGHGMPDGAIEPTFRWRQQLHGAHAGSSNPQYNQQGIGIVLVGNFEKDAPTTAQMNAAKSLVRTLKAAYHISAQNVLGHRDVRATECPGKLFPLTEVAREDSDLHFGERASGPLLPVIEMASQKRDLR
jgi:N-acetyl-anhydromuramyl-L-alanine amidase AmpD